jgi:hypothetical protein
MAEVLFKIPNWAVLLRRQYVASLVSRRTQTGFPKMITDVNRWDEKAGLRTGWCTLPSYRRALKHKS